MAARPIPPVARLLGWAALCCCLGLGACRKPYASSWPTGTARCAGALSRIYGTREGRWTLWFPNGELRERGQYEDGLRVGSWKQWYANGQARSEGDRCPDAARGDSPRTGYWRFWFENGALEAQGVYVHGLREGHWDYHLTDGELDGDRSGEYHLDQLLR